MLGPTNSTPCRFPELDQKLNELCNLETPGVVVAVARDDELVFRKSVGMASLSNYHPLSHHTALDVGSIAKVVTGLAVALLEEEGKLSTTQGVRNILPELPILADSLELRHLLHHESGLPNYTSLLYYMAGWHEHAPPSPNVVYETLCRVPGLAFKPGTHYEYCDSNYFLLARIVERVSSESFSAFARRRILEPLAMRDSYFTDEESTRGFDAAEGYVDYPVRLESPFLFRDSKSPEAFHPIGLQYTHVGAEGLRMSTADLLALGRHILSPTAISTEAMASRVLYAPRMRSDALGYGYGLNVGTYRGMPFAGHDGGIQGFTGSLAVFPKEALVIACMTNRHDIGACSIRGWVLDALGKMALQLPTHRLRIATKENTPQPGLYMNSTTASFLKIASEDDSLSASVNDGNAVPVEFGAWDAETAESQLGDLIRTPQDLESEQVLVWIEGKPIFFSTFMPHQADEFFTEYEGRYQCDALLSEFRVSALNSGIRLQNADPERPSMDLDYAPTIRDFFWSRDNHPGISQVQFLRMAGRVVAFVYRDYDGDGREKLIFEKITSTAPVTPLDVQIQNL